MARPPVENPLTAAERQQRRREKKRDEALSKAFAEYAKRTPEAKARVLEGFRQLVADLRQPQIPQVVRATAVHRTPAEIAAARQPVVRTDRSPEETARVAKGLKDLVDELRQNAKLPESISEPPISSSMDAAADALRKRLADPNLPMTAEERLETTAAYYRTHPPPISAALRANIAEHQAELEKTERAEALRRLK